LRAVRRQRAQVLERPGGWISDDDSSQEGISVIKCLRRQGESKNYGKHGKDMKTHSSSPRVGR